MADTKNIRLPGYRGGAVSPVDARKTLNDRKKNTDNAIRPYATKVAANDYLSQQLGQPDLAIDQLRASADPLRQNLGRYLQEENQLASRRIQSKFKTIQDDNNVSQYRELAAPHFGQNRYGFERSTVEKKLMDAEQKSIDSWEAEEQIRIESIYRRDGEMYQQLRTVLNEDQIKTLKDNALAATATTAAKLRDDLKKDYDKLIPQYDEARNIIIRAELARRIIAQQHWNTLEDKAGYDINALTDAEALKKAEELINTKVSYRISSPTWYNSDRGKDIYITPGGSDLFNSPFNCDDINEQSASEILDIWMFKYADKKDTIHFSIEKDGDGKYHPDALEKLQILMKEATKRGLKFSSNIELKPENFHSNVLKLQTSKGAMEAWATWVGNLQTAAANVAQTEEKKIKRSHEREINQRMLTPTGSEVQLEKIETKFETLQQKIETLNKKLHNLVNRNPIPADAEFKPLLDELKGSDELNGVITELHDCNDQAETCLNDLIAREDEVTNDKEGYLTKLAGYIRNQQVAIDHLDRTLVTTVTHADRMIARIPAPPPPIAGAAPPPNNGAMWNGLRDELNNGRARLAGRDAPLVRQADEVQDLQDQLEADRRMAHRP